MTWRNVRGNSYILFPKLIQYVFAAIQHTKNDQSQNNTPNTQNRQCQSKETVAKRRWHADNLVIGSRLKGKD